MNYERDPHNGPQKKSNKGPWLAAIVAVVAIGGWLVFQSTPEPEPVAVIEPVMSPPPEKEPFPESVNQAPDIPQVQPEPVEEPMEEEPLPTLIESDNFAKNVLAPLNNSEEFSLWLQTENLLQKGVTFIDGLSRGKILRKIIPIKPPSSKFIVTKEDDRIYLDPANYERYDQVVDLVTNIPPEAAYEAFHTLRPLLEAAYGELGYPEDKVDNALIGALDQILAAPETDAPIALKSESVAYTYADPNLESLSPIQKQLLRMGPENTAKIKAQAKLIKETLMANGAGED